jgi:hypothetical protein
MLLPTLGVLLRTTHRTVTERRRGKNNVGERDEEGEVGGQDYHHHRGAGDHAGVGVGGATTALAGTGIGATFNPGKTNTVNAVSKLAVSVVGPSLQVDNISTDANATALDL